MTHIIPIKPIHPIKKNEAQIMKWIAPVRQASWSYADASHTQFWRNPVWLTTPANGRHDDTFRRIVKLRATPQRDFAKLARWSRAAPLITNRCHRQASPVGRVCPVCPVTAGRISCGVAVQHPLCACGASLSSRQSKARPRASRGYAPRPRHGTHGTHGTGSTAATPGPSGHAHFVFSDRHGTHGTNGTNATR